MMIKIVKMISAPLHGLTLAALISMSGCAVLPSQLDSLGQDDGQSFKRNIALDDTQQIKNDELKLMLANAPSGSLNSANNNNKPVLSRGDIVRLSIYGMPDYDGLYQLDSSGEIDIPFTDSFNASGKSKQQLEDKIETELVSLGWFHKSTVNVSVSIAELAPVNINVSGAVFNPGQISINNKPIDLPNQVLNNQAGTYSSDRSTSSAIRAAGGVRPDADLSRVILKRGQKLSIIDMSSIITGDSVANTPYLMEGDQLTVLSTGIENPILIKPSQITPPGMRLYVSNLTSPGLSTPLGEDATRLPYGSSLLDSVVAANCVGGTQSASASRSVVLITKNYGSNQQIVINRSIDQLLANSSNVATNPYVMPNDAVACYDSRFANFRDVARGVSELFSPFIFWSVL